MGKSHLHEGDHPVAVEFHDHMIWVTLKDGRVVGSPIAWFPWLEQASVKQRSHFELHPFSIYWPDLDDGLDIQALVTGHWTTPMNAVADRQGAD